MRCAARWICNIAAENFVNDSSNTFVLRITGIILIGKPISTLRRAIPSRKGVVTTSTASFGGGGGIAGEA
jgi:hypothetical protein